MPQAEPATDGIPAKLSIPNLEPVPATDSAIIAAIFHGAIVGFVGCRGFSSLTGAPFRLARSLEG